MLITGTIRTEEEDTKEIITEDPEVDKEDPQEDMMKEEKLIMIGEEEMMKEEHLVSFKGWSFNDLLRFWHFVRQFIIAMLYIYLNN